MGTRNCNYQIPREGSHIHGSRGNIWKHWKTVSQNKHCCQFWWLRPTVWKWEQQHKTIVLDLPLHISFQKMYVNKTVCCTLGLIIFYLKLHKIHRIYILYLYLITYLICTNFTQWQYVLFFGVLILAQINFCPSLKESILMQY